LSRHVTIQQDERKASTERNRIKTGVDWICGKSGASFWSPGAAELVEDALPRRRWSGM
jgi:hypothetical protein